MSERRLRVAHVLHSFGTGGMEKGIATVVRHASPDFEHTIVCLDRGGETEKRLPPGTPVIAMHKPPGNSPRFLGRLARKLREVEPDVVHTRNWGGLDGVLAARLAGRNRVVHGEHGWDQGDPEGRNRKRKLFRRLLSFGIREFTCVSQHLRDWLRDGTGVRKPITQIYNGVDTTGIRAAGDREGARAELGLASDTFVVGIVARLDPIKDHPTLFRAIEGLRRRDPATRLLVIGDGPMRADLERQAGDGVMLLGDRRDVPRLLSALDVFVLCSRNEGISNTILEAMAAGLPVVASRVGGNPELVGDQATGLLFDAGDADALERCLARYNSDPGERARHGAEGGRRALDTFSNQAMVDGYETVWKRVAGLKPARREGR